MFSINLLSKQEKQNIRYEMFIRYVEALGGYLISVFFVFACLLVPSLLFLTYQKDDVLRSVDLEIANQKVVNVEKTISEINGLNDDINLVANHRGSARAVGDFFDSIAALAPTGVTLDDFSYDVQTKVVIMKGLARKREDFLEFKTALVAHPAVASVDSPISNIIKERDISFSLTVKVKQ